MITDLLIKIYVTPENIIGLILNICAIVAMCFIFQSFGEKWWKSFIPIYSNFILYKFLWGYGFLFVIELILDIINMRSLSIAKKHIFGNLFDIIKELIQTKQLNLDIIEINYILLIVCVLVFCITYCCIFIFKRITYWKLCNFYKLNLFFKIGTFIIPDLFLLIDYLYYKHKNIDNKISTML